LIHHLGIVRARLAASIGLFTLLLSGCSRLGDELPVMLYLALVIDQDSAIETATQTDFRRRIDLIVSDYRKIRPNVDVQVALYKRADLIRELQRRNASDLGPDLVITDAPQAKQLLTDGLTEALPGSEFKRQHTEESLWERVRLDDGRIAAQPIVIYPQIACFNSTVVQDPPATLRELLQQGAAGARVGLPVNFSELLWTSGSLGALQSLGRADSGSQTGARDMEAILGWLTWLQRASAQRNITFFQDQGQLQNLLRDGELDWVSCNSNSLLRLRGEMGNKLGVSPLPRGPAGAPSPVNSVRVLALGANSSSRQRQVALNLAQFITNPMVQRNLSLRSLAFLPVNPAVALPVKSSGTLATLVQSRADSAEHEMALGQIAHHRELSSIGSQSLVQLVFGAATPQASAYSLLEALEKQQ
tara:strand:- start:624 stop:1874 length:1251 start_codon:yes stop_codon:yes gene_type:complete